MIVFYRNPLYLTCMHVRCALLFGLLFTTQVLSATLSGQVLNQFGRPISGAIVTLFDDAGQRSESVYSDAFGQFRLVTDFSGALSLRARAPYFSDQHLALELATASIAPVTLVLEQQEDPVALAAALTASAHAAMLKFDRDDDAAAFRSQCHFCHQIGNQTTRQPRTDQQWQAVLERMQSYGSLITSDNEQGFRTTLTAGFDGQPIKAVQTHDVSPELASALYQEWQLGDAMSYIHDIEVGPDGKLYGVDMGNDQLYILDPQTGTRETVVFPDSDLPLGGLFAGAIAPLGTFNAKHGPHSIQAGPDGKLWTTNSLAGELMSFDPKSREFKLYPIGRDAIYPHTLRWDSEGILWFTLALSNQIGRFDPKTAQFTLIATPTNGFWRWLSDAMLPSLLEVASWFPKQDLQLTLSHHKPTGQGHDIFNLPYGIDVNPKDGSIWYSKLYAGYIGRVDPVTFAVEEIKTPLKGPRRLRFDKDGTLWIPSFDESALMKFDPVSREFKLFSLPTLSPEEYEIPYALGVHPQTQEIWITSNLSDRVFRFMPKEERFISYPSPTRVTFLRDMVFLPDGRVCSSNANLPAPAIEGGLAKILCIDADAALAGSAISQTDQVPLVAQ